MLFASVLLAFAGLVFAETGLDGWLRYARLGANFSFNSLPDRIVVLNSSQTSPVFTAGLEIQNGIGGIFGKTCSLVQATGTNSQASNGTVLVGTLNQYAAIGGDTTAITTNLSSDGFWLNASGPNVQIVGQNERGALYGAFKYLSMLAQGNTSQATLVSNPDAPIRWVNQWDNLQGGGTHGSVERGYGGPSIFFENGTVKSNLTRAAQYARLLSSIGVNAVVVNNVNANESFVTAPIMDGLKRIADVFRPYGVQLGMSLYFASPQALGELDTFDPLNDTVVAWWQNRTDQIYKRIPDFAGYLVKANSEGQPGPITYNRTLADGANLFAGVLKPYGGTVMFRAFVYDSTSLNESIWTEDRANAAVQFFNGLDGKFDDNVVIQIKYGPIDFQVREPTSPLFAHLQQSNTAIELEISQEYLGQQCHLVYLPPLWKTVLDFDLRVDNTSSYVRNIISGQRFNRSLGGYAGVANVGTNQTWLGSHLAMSNLYAFGRLAWDPTLDPSAILDEWTKLTFSSDPTVLSTINSMSMESWPTYENYSGNLGIQTLTDILYAHYGPNPASQDNNPWGQWTRADQTTIGMDRTVSNGTGFSGQYPPAIAAMYENISSTPDDLLLWFHHVPYTQPLPMSGKTVIQHFYDAHYAGAANAQTFPSRWTSLKDKIDPQRYEEVLYRLTYQAGHSLVWRDAINDFYFNLSGIHDQAGRVRNHPYRIEAEDMMLDGYQKYAVSPWNVASGGGLAIVTTSNTTVGTASTVLDSVASGVYDIAVNYYDMAIGRSQWQLYLNETLVGQWIGDSDLTLGHSPSNYIDGHSATRITFPAVQVQKGDVLKIVGMPDGIEPAPLDYISVLPQGVVD